MSPLVTCSWRQAADDAIVMSEGIQGITAVVYIPEINSFAAVDVCEALDKNQKIVSLVADGFGIQDIDLAFRVNVESKEVLSQAVSTWAKCFGIDPTPYVPDVVAA